MKASYIWVWLLIFPVLLVGHNEVHADRIANFVEAIHGGQITTAEQYFAYVKKHRIPHDLVRQTVNQFIDLHPTIDEINQYTRLYGNISDPFIYIQLKSYGLANKLPQNTHEFFTLIQYSLPPGYNPNESYKDDLASLLVDHLDAFLALHPSIEEMKYLTKNWGHTTSPALFIQLKKYALENQLVKTVDDFFTLLDYALPYGRTPNKEYIRQRSSLFQNHLEQFFALNPSTKDVAMLTRDLPELKHLFLPFRKPLTPESIYEQINLLQKRAYTTLQDICNNEQRRIKRREKDANKRKYVLQQISHIQAHTKNAIGHKVLEFMKNPNVNPNNTQATYRTFQSIEEQFNQLIQQARNNIDILERTLNYEGIRKNEWPLPTQFATIADEIDIDHCIDSLNQSISSCSYSTENSCSICFETMAEDEKVTISTCGHTTCTNCYHTHVQIRLEDNQFPIRCFHKECQAVLTEKDISKAKLTDEDLVRWRKQTMLHLPRVIKCPHNYCDEILSIRNQATHHNVLCGKCFQEVCAQCGQRAHLGIPCTEVPELKKSLLSGEKEFQELLNNQIIQPCPKCNTPGIRKYGCLHITCPMPHCKTKWNYKGNYRSDEDNLE